MVDQHSVREASEQDIDRVVELWAEHLDFHARFDPRFRRREGSEDGFADHLRSRLGDVDFLLLVAEIDGEVEGFLHGELSDYPPCFADRSHGLIYDLAVSPRRQRAGLGTALLENGMAWFSAKGVPTVEGRVLMSNPVAMAFWRKSGFEPYVQTFRTPTK
ncbi:MAG: GNAT family N-acetyltransferase [Gemmatimonadales bacterium]|jgi:ribosomal protein S18 acetylase RimI-like enzyme